MKVILIAGGSASGKSSLSRKLLDALRTEGKNAELIIMDSYYKEIPADREINEYRATTNFDRVSMFEIDDLKDDVISLNEGRDINRYEYDFTTNRRRAVGSISQPEFLIIEGLFTMHLKRKLPADLSQLTVFVEVSSYLTLINRRIIRDQATRNLTPAQTIQGERKYVGIAYFHNIASGMRGVDISVVNDDPIDNEQHPLEKGIDDILASLEVERTIVPIPEEEYTCAPTPALG
ncbi:MAG: zeta toxin family protein [Legionellaceae bacterium]|nr:zeta toxin family protein [Legionellaceae bacterium]